MNSDTLHQVLFGTGVNFRKRVGVGFTQLPETISNFITLTFAMAEPATAPKRMSLLELTIREHVCPATIPEATKQRGFSLLTDAHGSFRFAPPSSRLSRALSSKSDMREAIENISRSRAVSLPPPPPPEIEATAEVVLAKEAAAARKRSSLAAAATAPLAGATP